MSTDGTGFYPGQQPASQDGRRPRDWQAASVAAPAGSAGPALGDTQDFLWSPQPPRKRVVGRVLLSAVAVCALVGGGVVLGRVFAPTAQPAAPTPEAQAVSGTVSAEGLRDGSGSFVCSSPGVGVTCWGADQSGQTTQPAAVPGLESARISALSVGRGFAVAVDDGGVVYAWGVNDLGQLGTAPGDPAAEAVEVGSLPAVPSQVVSGNEHTCALVDSSVWCFGSNRYGQVTGTATTEALGLTQVPDVTGAVDLGTSGYDTWALASDGTWVWGNNSWGQADPGNPQQGVVAPVLIPAE